MVTVNTDSLVRQEIGSVSVIELARQFGTPTYVYDETVIRQRIDELRAFDFIRYAQKACSNLAVDVNRLDPDEIARQILATLTQRKLV